MSERPILFSGPMVRAILDGRKTQTRRVVKPQPCNDPAKHHPIAPHDNGKGGWNWVLAATGHGLGDPFPCPYGAPGETLWVRETWAYYGGNEYLYQRDRSAVMYRATWDDDPRRPLRNLGEPLGHDRWRTSIHMPRWASRLSLLVKSVRVERLQEISDSDVFAEGLQSWVDDGNRKGGDGDVRSTFAALWDSINAKSHPWASNPWVWVVEFERVAQEVR